MSSLSDDELRALDPAELDSLIANLEAQVKGALADLRRARRRRSALIASSSSKLSRARKLDTEARQIYAAWSELGHTRGAIPILMAQFDLPERTIHRRLKLAGRRKPEYKSPWE